MPAWVASLGKDNGASNWDICRRESLMATRANAASSIRAGDDVFIWLAQSGFIAWTRATTDARAVSAADNLPWPDKEPYRYVWDIDVLVDRLDDPVDESWGDVQAGSGIRSSPQFFPSVPAAGEPYLQRLLTPTDPLSVIESHMLGQLRLPQQDERVFRQVMRDIRQGQDRFRAQVDVAYRGRCAITGVGDREVLEAAHIAPHLGLASNDPRNGLLLRRDAHALFDAHLLTVQSDGTVRVAPSVSSSEYRGWTESNLPQQPQHRPDAPALAAHNAEFARRHGS